MRGLVHCSDEFANVVVVDIMNLVCSTSQKNFRYTRGNTPKRITRRGLISAVSACEQMSWRWQGVGNTVFNLTGLRNNPPTPIASSLPRRQ